MQYVNMTIHIYIYTNTWSVWSVHGVCVTGLLGLMAVFYILHILIFFKLHKYLLKFR